MADMVQLTVAIAYTNDPKTIHQETLQYSFPMIDDGDWMKSFVAYLNEEDNEESKPSIIT